MSVGEQLRRLRESRGMSREEVAAAMEVSEETIARWESGKREPDLPTVRRLAAVLSVPVADLLASPSDNQPSYDTRATRADVQGLTEALEEQRQAFVAVVDGQREMRAALERQTEQLGRLTEQLGRTMASRAGRE